MAGCRPGPLSEGHPCHALPTRPMAPRAPHTAGHPCPLPNPAPHGTLAYHGRQARCPGYPLSDTHHSQPRSQPVNRAPAPLQTGSSLHSHQQQNDFHFVNLTNPANSTLKLTPGTLGRESLLPPITPRTMHSPFTPNTHRPAGLTHTHVPYALLNSTHQHTHR